MGCWIEKRGEAVELRDVVRAAEEGQYCALLGPEAIGDFGPFLRGEFFDGGGAAGDEADDFCCGELIGG